ncbi:MAG TPA: peptidoglycan recognition family protein [Dermatophilaceae bacterium]|nr:peptidoglycan recognition family protein [Dermatophilaceae bacterium]
MPDPIPYPAARLAQMADYSKRHYGTASSALTPSVIVVHYTETDTYRPVWNLFAANTAALGELPGVCAHFVIDQGGTIHQLVPTTVRCRHTIGLNDSAIGIEVVQSSRGHGAGWAEQQILARPAQATALVALIRQLQAQHGIPTSSVIGHAMANADPRFHDLLGWRNDHTDWGAGPIAELRARL